METMASAPKFDIRPVDRGDIPRLAQIHVVTCEMDNCFKLYFKTTEEFLEKVTDMLERQVGDAAWHHAKAVDRATGTLASWASWYTPTDEQIRARDDNADMSGCANHNGAGPRDITTIAASGASGDAALSGATAMGRTAGGGFGFPPGLSQHIKQDTDKWIQAWTHGRRHVLVRGLFTDPTFQRRGMGGALVEYGNNLADKAVLPVLLQASAYGAPVYARKGLHTVQYLDVDLRKWAPGAASDDKGYGNYRFRYMMRLPKTISSQSDQRPCVTDA